jgi:hypothetical protein
MSDHTYKMIELVGSSQATVEDAVKNALSRADKTVRNSRWFEITQIRGEIEDGAVAYWQVGLKVGFNIEGKTAAEKKPEAPAKKPLGKVESTGKYRCKVCGYIYDPAKGDPDNGVKPGTAFKDLPADWKCPECGVNKEQFEPVKDE